MIHCKPRSVDIWRMAFGFLDCAAMSGQIQTHRLKFPCGGSMLMDLLNVRDKFSNLHQFAIRPH